MRGRPQVPNLFVGGPLRGPPPPKGWNFFILRSLAVRLALRADYVARRGVRWQLARRTAAPRETLTVPPIRRISPRDCVAARSTAAAHCCGGWRVWREPVRPSAPRKANALGPWGSSPHEILVRQNGPQTGRCAAMDDYADRRTSLDALRRLKHAAFGDWTHPDRPLSAHLEKR